MPGLSELDVLVVDCQTTGATPALGAVLELGWCVARANRPELERLQAHWIRLPPGTHVSRPVRMLTGFDDSCLEHALAPEAAWRELRQAMCAERMPCAIHFARFELSFLRDWAERFEPGSPFPIDAVCVHAIAQKLYPDLPRRSIRALAGYLGHGLHLERRSLEHVEATAFIWRKLSAELEARGVGSFSEIAQWLATPGPARPRSTKRRYPIAPERYRALPNAPGVYRFLRANGDLLYVGKAASLRKRVTSHFGARSSRELSIEMLTQVSDIAVTLTPSALEAALLENEHIKSLCPPYNVQLVMGERPSWFTDGHFSDARAAFDLEHRVGPLPTPLSLSSLGALVALARGEAPERSRRARAVAAADRWAPDEPTFLEGFAELLRRHFGIERAKPSFSNPEAAARQAVLAAAKRLVASARLEGDAEPEETEDEGPEAWNPERVTRHLERALARAYRLLRRAMWLRRLANCAVVYSEPDSQRARLIVLSGGEVVESADAPLEPPPLAPLGARIAALEFDRAKYDRLRVLSTELDRIRRDGGSVAVYVAPGRRLGERVLDGIFGWT